MNDSDALGAHERSRNRSESYWFLSEFYLAAPERDRLLRLQSTLAQLGGLRVAGANDAGLVLIARAVAGGVDVGSLATSLNAEFTRLFAGLHAGAALAPPYESVCRESRLVGEITQAVLTAYARAGYGTIDASVGPQDHLGVELRFLSLLCCDEAVAWEEGDDEAALRVRDEQRVFLEAHAMTWIPQYCRQMEQATDEPYFKGAALLTTCTLEADHAALCARVALHPEQ